MMTFFTITAGVLAFVTTVGTIVIYEVVRKPVVEIFGGGGASEETLEAAQAAVTARMERLRKEGFTI